jgi:hypothetical protein
MIDSKFEEFAKDRGLNTEKLCHGDYKLFVTGEAYAAWQAASAVVPEWIKCSERLTENRCLAYTPNEDAAIMLRIVPVRMLRHLSDVTHWMPLPAPPQQEQES